MYHFNDVIHRTRAAVLRAGGEFRSGVQGLPRQIKRWTVLRSPHVNKKSREKFWMVNHLRVYHWDAPAHVDIDAPMHISRCVPANVAIRMIENVPGLMALKSVYTTIDRVNNPPESAGSKASTKKKSKSSATPVGSLTKQDKDTQHTRINATQS